MLNIHKVLYDYIVKKYDSVVNFSVESGISLIDLNAVLLKENISKEIGIGLSLCDKLNIDIDELIFNGQIKELKRKKNNRAAEKSEKTERFEKFKEADNAAAKNEIYGKCMRLSENEKKAVLEYINNISGQKSEKV